MVRDRNMGCDHCQWRWTCDTLQEDDSGLRRDGDGNSNNSVHPRMREQLAPNR